MRHILPPLCLVLAACTSDPTDANPPLDSGPVDVADIRDAPDVQRVDVGEDRPAPVDIGPDAGAVVDVALDMGGAVDAGADVTDAQGVVDVAPTADVPGDAGERPLCTTPRMPCRVHADCASCVPMPRLYWCCVPDDPGPTVCLAAARPCS